MAMNAMHPYLLWPVVPLEKQVHKHVQQCSQLTRKTKKICPSLVTVKDCDTCRLAFMLLLLFVIIVVVAVVFVIVV